MLILIDFGKNLASVASLLSYLRGAAPRVRTQLYLVTGWIIAALIIPVCGFAQTVRDNSAEVQVIYSRNPLAAKIEWKPPESGGTSNYLTLSRREWVARSAARYGDPGFVSVGLLPVAALSYTETNLSPGQLLEYELVNSTTTNYRLAVFPVGSEVPWREKRGGVLLVIDESITAGIALELATLESDLTLDGYTVTRTITPRMKIDPATTGTAIGPQRRAEVDAVRSAINVWYRKAPTLNRSVLLIGRVPIPYSGTSAADGHADHQGAWSSDLYYADIDDAMHTGLPQWTDTSSQITGVPARTQNEAGDGKFDQATPIDGAELEIGRIDFSRITFAPELDLLRRYLLRNHAYRTRTGAYQQILPKMLIVDNFGTFGGENFARIAWEGAAAIFGKNSAFAASWFAPGTTAPHFISYGCGAGSYTSVGGIGSSGNFSTQVTSSPFTALFGSYFGDWDYPNGLLATAIAGPNNNLALSTLWANRIDIDFTPLAVGASIGVVARRKADHLHNGSLLGDPTLRIQYFAPPQNLQAIRASNSVSLTWAGSPTVSTNAQFVGYHVFRRPVGTPEFVRITGVPLSAEHPHGDAISELTFRDTSSIAQSSAMEYAVVTMGLIYSGTASYFDSSQAISISVPGGSTNTSAPNAPSGLGLSIN